MSLIQTDNFILALGDCLERLKEVEDNSVDSIVTDPPYGLSFMGKKWDYDVPSEEIWRECFRVLKPGGHLLAFAGTRTQHRMAVRIEDAGFEIRDMIAWVYGSGFPKSLDVSKAIDKAAGAEREVVGQKDVGPDMRGGNFKTSEGRMVADITAPATDAAKQWQGWGTALKPALEPITVARKPLIGTVAENVLAHGTGALNIDGCRVATDPTVDDPRLGGAGTWNTGKMAKNVYEGGYAGETVGSSPLGRWPANLIHDGSEEVLAGFPITTSGKAAAGGHKRSAENMEKGSAIYGRGKGISGTSTTDDAGVLYGDSGSAARFFYCAKTSKKDREEGCETLPVVESVYPGANSFDENGNRLRADGSVIPPLKARNNHPTVKPTDLMRYLCRLVTPPNGIVLDPFMGSGSTGKAALKEGLRFIGIERDDKYFAIAKARIEAAAGGVIS